MWSTVHSALTALHADYAVAEYRRAAALLDLPTDRVPQLADVSDRLTELTGWRLCAVPGLVSTAEFFGALADRCFPVVAVRAAFVGAVLHTRARRHPRVDRSRQLAGLAADRRAVRTGRPGRRSRSPIRSLAELLGRVFWFTLEFGVAMEDGALRTYGAGLLSSFGEITNFRNAEVRPFDTAAMGEFDDYEISTFQDVLFAADVVRRRRGPTIPLLRRDRPLVGSHAARRRRPVSRRSRSMSRRSTRGRRRRDRLPSVCIRTSRCRRDAAGCRRPAPSPSASGDADADLRREDHATIAPRLGQHDRTPIGERQRIAAGRPAA